MLQTVTAIIVARSGSTRVQRTLESLRAQTRRPDAVIVIETDSDGRVNQTISDFGPSNYLTARERLSFPAAVSAAVRTLDAPTGPEQWLWLLAQDTAPEPVALERLMAVGEVSPSVAVAGPKLVEWDDPSRLRGFGVSMTRSGLAVPVVEDELDQGQHDGISDVLGVHEAGMLVRHSVFADVGGLDVGLPVVDGGLDFCVRARLAGHRVVVAPNARVAIGGDGVVGARLSQRSGAQRVSYRVRRAAQLHRRLAYAPAATLPLHWLVLVPLAVVRSIGWLIGKHPGRIGGELGAAFQTAFGGGHLGQARRNVRRAKKVGWAVIAPLRVPSSQVRRRRMLAREAALELAHGDARNIDFFGTGGGWVVAGALVGSVALQLRLLGADALGGGGLLPLNSSVSELWAQLGWGWRDVGTGFTGPSDPFAAVLALIGSMTFWQPSLSLVLLWLLAMPIAALGAWLLAARFTVRAAPRAMFALAWAFAPPLLAALAAGRPAAVIAHVLLPWLVLAAVLARSSWTASGATALLAAGLSACAPSLTPALALAWLVWTATSGRGVFRTVFVPVPAVALFLPLALTQLSAGHPERIFADPGTPVAAASATPIQLLLGFPGSAGGWHQFGLPTGAASIVAVVLFAPIALLGLAALFLRPSVRAAGAVLIALAGLATAVLCSNVALQTTGGRSVGLWAGSGLSLYWLGATGAALLALSALGRGATAPAALATVAALIAVAPLALTIPRGTASVVAGATRQLPAYVAAEAADHPRTATLVITPTGDGTVTAGLVHGSGETLDAQSTLASTRVGLTNDDRRIAALAANMISPSGYDAAAQLKSFGISFVFLHTGADPDTEEAALAARAASALDADALVTRVGETTSGTLWGTTASYSAAALPAHPGGWRQNAIVLVWAIVFGVFVLLSLPTGRSSVATPRGRDPRAGGDAGDGGLDDAAGAEESVLAAERDDDREAALVGGPVGGDGAEL